MVCCISVVIYLPLSFHLIIALPLAAFSFIYLLRRLRFDCIVLTLLGIYLFSESIYLDWVIGPYYPIHGRDGSIFAVRQKVDIVILITIKKVTLCELRSGKYTFFKKKHNIWKENSKSMYYKVGTYHMNIYEYKQ